jgi:hypothetical protein
MKVIPVTRKLSTIEQRQGTFVCFGSKGHNFAKSALDSSFGANAFVVLKLNTVGEWRLGRNRLFRRRY